MELISVIIPIYNSQKYLDKCIRSFIDQTYTNLEIVLIDDGSTDESLKICESYSVLDSRIKVFHKENSGQSDARNVGIEMSSGELIVFHDSDDYVDKDYIEYLYNIKNKYKTEMSVCAYNVVDEKGRILFGVNGGKEIKLTKEEFFKRMLNEEGITVSPCAKLYERKLFENVRFPSGRIYEDNGTIYKAVDKVAGFIAYGAETKSYYTIHPESTMRKPFSNKKLDMIEMTDQMCDYLDLHYNTLSDYILRRRIYARFHILRQMDYKNDSYKEERKAIVDYILKNKPFIMASNCVPKRDKIACFLLSINTNLFYIAWNIYQTIRYKKYK